MRLGNTSLAPLVLLFSSVVSVQDVEPAAPHSNENNDAESETRIHLESDDESAAIQVRAPYSQHNTTIDLLGGQTVRGPEKLGDHYPIRISSFDDASQIKPEVEGSTRWVYRLCHPGASFINVHFAEFGKWSFCQRCWLVDFDAHTGSSDSALFDSFSFQTLTEVAAVRM
jgi:hypothetical protein